MSDLIDRQAAIRLITDYNGVVDKSVAKRLLMQMPEAQPEPIWLPLTESDIDHLFSYYAKEKDENLTEQAQLLKECMWVGYMAAKKEQPEGKWIYIGGSEWRCSECGDVIDIIGYDYCPNCGSYNGGEQDATD